MRGLAPRLNLHVGMPAHGLVLEHITQEQPFEPPPPRRGHDARKVQLDPGYLHIRVTGVAIPATAALPVNRAVAAAPSPRWFPAVISTRQLERGSVGIAGPADCADSTRRPREFDRAPGRGACCHHSPKRPRVSRIDVASL